MLNEYNDECMAIMSTNISPFLNFTEILIPQRQAQRQGLEEGASAVERVPIWSLIDTGALHGNYVGQWIIKYGLTILRDKSGRQICSPINNQCVPCADSVIIIACIYDVDKINKFEVELELKILPSLDDKEYGMIIGLPSIKKHNLTHVFASQFNDSKLGKLADPIKEIDLISKKKELKSVLFRMIINSDSLLNKSANFSVEQEVGSVGVGLKRSLSPSAHTRTITNSARTISEVDRNNDSLSNALEKTNRRSFNHKLHRYDEDDEVIQSDFWDDAWMKDGVKSAEEEDFIKLIVSKITSTDPTFIIEAQLFLEEYRDLFSRNLNPIPAELDPLEIEVDSKKFNVSQNMKDICKV